MSGRAGRAAGSTQQSVCPGFPAPPTPTGPNEHTSPQAAKIAFANPPVTLIVGEIVLRLTEIVEEPASEPDIEVKRVGTRVGAQADWLFLTPAWRSLYPQILLRVVSGKSRWTNGTG